MPDRSKFEKRLGSALEDFSRPVADQGDPAARAAWKKLPRHERRRIEARSKKVNAQLAEHDRRVDRSGVGYGTDRLLREMAHEYNIRFFTSGTMTQPKNLRYFEPFMKPVVLGGQDFRVPGFDIRPEVDHLFHAPDFLDHITGPDAPSDTTGFLHSNLAEGIIHHYSALGDLADFRFLRPDGVEFVVSGFSMIRWGAELYWLILGGYVLSEELWNEEWRSDEVKLEEVPPEKRPMFQRLRERQGGLNAGGPVSVPGYERIHQVVAVGSIGLDSGKLNSRCVLKDYERTWSLSSDDPDFLDDLRPEHRERMAEAMAEQVDEHGILWDLAHSLLALPQYFAFKITVVRHVLRGTQSAQQSGTAAIRVKVEDDVGAKQFKKVAALEILDINRPALGLYRGPAFQVEVDGFWRRLPEGQFGHDRNGEPVAGRTWVQSHVRWRDKPRRPREILVKSSVAAARIRAKSLQDAEAAELSREIKGPPETPRAGPGYVYVMRNPIFTEEVYKVGYTNKTPSERAEELSAATGVPLSYIVVQSWQCHDAAALERAIHVALSPYRITQGREFFSGPFERIRGVVEAELARLRSSPSGGPNSPAHQR